MDTNRLKNGWYLTTRPAKNDIMVSAFDPTEKWPDVRTAVFINKIKLEWFQISLGTLDVARVPRLI